MRRIRFLCLRKSENPGAPALQPDDPGLQCEIPECQEAYDAFCLADLEAVNERPQAPGFLFLCRARVEGRGEDAFAVGRDAARALIGVFDGLGGSGARVYPRLDGRTGAWAASRAAALATRRWFQAGAGEEALASALEDALRALSAGQAPRQALLGSLTREFPTTVAAIMVRPAPDRADALVCWCGDSRCYALDEQGLHQITADDSATSDALRCLREDAPMTNVACASAPFALHRRHLILEKPAVLLSATDGCFGYLPTPMDFEKLLLETLLRSTNFDDWARRLEARLRPVAGDDYTLAAWPWGFGSYAAMKKAFRRRLARMKTLCPGPSAQDAEIDRLWNAYRVDYENLLPTKLEEA